MDKPDLTPNRTPPRKFTAPNNIAICDECGRKFNLFNEDDANEWYYGHDCEVDYHDPLHGDDKGPCDDFAPDTLGDNPEVCTTCFYHKLEHIIDRGIKEAKEHNSSTVVPCVCSWSMY